MLSIKSADALTYIKLYFTKLSERNWKFKKNMFHKYSLILTIILFTFTSTKCEDYST